MNNKDGRRFGDVESDNLHSNVLNRGSMHSDGWPKGSRIGIMGGTFDPIHNAHLALAEEARLQLSLDRVWFMPAGSPYLNKHNSISPSRHRFRMTELALGMHPWFRVSRFEEHSNYQRVSARPADAGMVAEESAVSVGRENVEGSAVSVGRKIAEGSTVSDEGKGSGRTYTADTLRMLKEVCPETEFYFIIGADQLYTLESWYKPEEVFRHAVIVCAERDVDDTVSGRRDFLAQAEYLRGKFQARIELLSFVPMDISSTLVRKRTAEGRDIAGLVPEAVAEYIKANNLYSPEA